MGPVVSADLDYLAEKNSRDFVKTGNYERALSFEREMNRLIEAYKTASYDGLLADFTLAYNLAQKALDSYLADNNWTEADDPRVIDFRKRLNELHDVLLPNAALWQSTTSVKENGVAATGETSKSDDSGTLYSAAGPISAMVIAVKNLVQRLAGRSQRHDSTQARATSLVPGEAAPNTDKALLA